MQRQSWAACLSESSAVDLGEQNDGTPDSWWVWVGLDRWWTTFGVFSRGYIKSTAALGARGELRRASQSEREPESPSLLQALVNQPRSLSRLISAHGQVKGQRTNRRPRSLRLQDRSRPVWVHRRLGPTPGNAPCQPRNRVKLLQIAGLTRWLLANPSTTYPLRPAPGPTISHRRLLPLLLPHTASLTSPLYPRKPRSRNSDNCHNPCSTAFFSYQPASSASVSDSHALYSHHETDSRPHTPWSLESLLSCTGSRSRQILLSVVLPVPASIILVDNCGPFHHIYPQ